MRRRPASWQRGTSSWGLRRRSSQRGHARGVSPVICILSSACYASMVGGPPVLVFPRRQPCLILPLLQNSRADHQHRHDAQCMRSEVTPLPLPRAGMGVFSGSSKSSGEDGSAGDGSSSDDGSSGGRGGLRTARQSAAAAALASAADAEEEGGGPRQQRRLARWRRRALGCLRPAAAAAGKRSPAAAAEAAAKPGWLKLQWLKLTVMKARAGHGVGGCAGACTSSRGWALCRGHATACRQSSHPQAALLPRPACSTLIAQPDGNDRPAASRPDCTAACLASDD